MSKVKVANYTDSQVKEMVDTYTAETTQAGRDRVVDALAASMGKHVRSIRAKLVSLKVYQKVVKASTVTGKPAIKKDQMAENLAELMGIFLNTESVAKMNKTDIRNIGDEVERLQKQIADFEAVAEFAEFDFITESENMAEFYRLEAERVEAEKVDPDQVDPDLVETEKSE